MRKLIIALTLITSIGLASCGDYASRAKGTVMVGNKAFKIVHVHLDEYSVTMVVPVDSQVSIIPANVTYQSGKTTETTIVVP